MKKLVPYLLASAIALPALAIGAMNASAQPPAAAGARDCHGGGGDHHGGPRGGHGRHRRGHGDPAARVEHHAAMMTAILNLDANQQAGVRRILTAEATEMETIRQQPRGDAQHQAIEALHLRTKASIAALLSPSQRATVDRMDAIRQADRARHESERAARPAPSGAPAQPGPATTSPSR